MGGLARDLSFTLRILRKRPGFTLVAALTLGLGIGASTAVFSAVHGVLLTPLPYDDPQELTMVWGVLSDSDLRDTPLAVGTFNQLREGPGSFEGIAGFWTQQATLIGDPRPEQVSLAWVTDAYFELLGVSPIQGRLLDPGEEDGALLSHGLWVRRFGGDPAVMGRQIRVNGNPLTIVGVLPPDPPPDLPTVGNRVTSSDVFRLMPPGWMQGDDLVWAWIRTFGRLRDGATLEQAQAELDALAVHFREISEDHAQVGYRLEARPLRDNIVGNVKGILWVLMGAVGFVLLIACANVANLLLVRGSARSREVSIRAALGGGRWAIARQMLVESGVLALLGAAVGVALAWGGIRLLAVFQPGDLPRLEAVGLNLPVLAFALGAATLSALTFGLLPAFEASRSNLADSLKERSSGSGHVLRGSNVLVVAEVGLSLVLLIGAGLLLRSFAGLLEVRPGYHTEGALTFQVTPPEEADDQAKVLAFWDELEARLSTLPGVTAVGNSNRLPLAGGLFAAGVQLADDPEEEFGEIDVRWSSPGFFRAMGTRLLEGDMYAARGDGNVVVVDRVARERFWPGENPIGKQLRLTPMMPDTVWATVVGVVEHMRHERIDRDGRPSVFLPSALNVGRMDRYVVLKAGADPAALAGPSRSALDEISSTSAMARVRTFEELVDRARAPTRFSLMLIGAFAVIAAFLAAVGLYGVIAFSVSRRTREIGIRMTFGAESSGILRMVLARGLGLTLVGVAVGLVGSLGLTRVIEGMLFGVPATDPLTYGLLALGLTAVGLLASWLPARRAVKVDPLVALRAE